jgi:hypothetical protein
MFEETVKYYLNRQVTYASLNAMCLIQYVLNCEQHFSYFDPY